MLRFALPVSATLTLAALGCQPATSYAPPGEKRTDTSLGAAADKPDGTPPLSPDLMWQDDRQAPRNPIPILFIHGQKSPEAWAKLTQFWTRTTGPQDVAAVFGMTTGLTPFPLPRPNVAAPDPEVIKIKVPRGLDDPTPHIPEFNPPTLAKWDLGRQLFFDKSWLTAKGNVSCAGCHDPDRGFTDGLRDHDGFNTPTLVNVVYSKALFWDGRANCLEEVFARSLEDERETNGHGPFRHVWSGAVQRLLNRDGPYLRRFGQVFEALPSQDAVAKSLATYMRTLLAAGSLHDRAVFESGRPKERELGASDYEKFLDADALKLLDRSNPPKADVAAELYYGYRLFHNLVPDRKLNCINCHNGPLFTDGKFHNVGVGDRYKMVEKPFAGRFASAPLGQKDRSLIGAYKTPTLRGLLFTSPYFHDGEQKTLTDALRFHADTFIWNPYLAPEMRAEGQSTPERYLKLTEPEIKALVAFLTALNGAGVDQAVRAPSSR
jgi:cytochrome c peroxidase